MFTHGALFPARATIVTAGVRAFLHGCLPHPAPEGLTTVRAPSVRRSWRA